MKPETDRTTQTPEDVLNELRSLVSDAERILGQAPGGACCDVRVEALRERLGAAQERATELFQEGKQKVVAGARRADETIRENPYQSIAVAVGVGLLAGALLGRRWNAP